MKVPTFRKYGFKKAEMDQMEKRNKTISQLLGHEIPLAAGVVIGLIIYALNIKRLHPSGIGEILGQVFLFGSVGLIAVGIPMIIFHYANKAYYKYLEKHNPQYQNIQKFKADKADFDHWKLRTDENFWKLLDGLSVESEFVSLYERLGYTINEKIKINNSRNDYIVVKEDEELYLRCITRRDANEESVNDFKDAFSKSDLQQGILFSLFGFDKDIKQDSFDKNVTLYTLKEVTSLARTVTKLSQEEINESQFDPTDKTQLQEY